MEIILQRTRIMFKNYSQQEKEKIEDLAATEDKAFIYQDPEDKMICFPPGLLNAVKKTFPRTKITDESDTYWDYAYIQPVENNAKPRNQLQIDFIKFVLDNANKKRNVAGILGTGTGKEEPNYRHIPTPTKDGFTRMGDIKIGDKVYGSDGSIINVTGVFPQGNKDVYRIYFSDGKTAECGIDHLWNVKIGNEVNTMSLRYILRIYEKIDLYIPELYKAVQVDDRIEYDEKVYTKIDKVEFIGKYECTCIMVDSKDHLYVTQDYFITHNTFMACYSAIKVGLRTLIIAPTSGIKSQWAETLTGMFNVPPERVLVVNSPKDFINVKADFVIVSQASLASLNKSYDLEKIMKLNKFGIKVIDEVQMWFHNIVKIDGSSNICHNWYITGTFGRSGQEENDLYQKMFGNLAIFREKQKAPTLFDRKPGNVYGDKPHMNVYMMWAHSGISKEEIKSVNTSVRYSERSGKWHRYGISVPAYMDIVIPPDGKKTKFLNTILKVIKLAEYQVNYGRTLVLGNTVSSAEIVAGYLYEMFPNKKIGVIHSRQSKEKNDEVKATCDIIVSTINSCGTGFDLKDLSKLVVFAQYSSWILTDQISGRCRRRPDGKETYMYDIVDADIKQLRSWANNRSDVLRRKSKRFKVVDI